MKILEINKLLKTEYSNLLKRSTSAPDPNVVKKIEDIIRNVKIGGDKEILALQKKLYETPPSNFIVSSNEFANAEKTVSQKFRKAARQAAKNIKLFQQSQKPKNPKPVSPTSGIKLWKKWNPIEKIGIYVPGGNAFYPSSLLMTVIPAQIADCNEIYVCTPPDKNGCIAPEVLFVANLCKVTTVFKIGGAEAIAAFTYGTSTVPKVDKIFGAGGIFATTAKRLLSKEIAIDMPAGPSENLIIADKFSNPKFIAADLITDAEHGADSASVLITNSQKIAAEVNKEIDKQIQSLSTKDQIISSINSFGFIGIVDNIDQAFKFVNDYAPEHLQIMTKNAVSDANKVKNAGSIFIGSWTCKSAGDYATGANHILPTGQYAKSFSALSVESFGKWTEFQSCTKKGLTRIRKTIETFSDVEKLPAHKNSVVVRFSNY